MPDELEVFQEMAMRGPIELRPALREALIAAAAEPWGVDLERSAEVARNAVTSQDVLLFQRQEGDNFPASGLTLWGADDGYYVPNIVPLQAGSLTFSQYNAVLADFVDRIAAPAAAKHHFRIETTSPRQSLEDWLSLDPRDKLRLFSTAANKSSGASHPADEGRWFDFIIAVHRSGDRLDAGRLARWLHEVESWDETSAHDLAGQYERSLALLARYDSQ